MIALGLALASFAPRVGAAYTATVVLINGLTGAILPDERVTLKEKQSDGSLVWKDSEYTDAQGQASFELDEGVSYLFSATPYGLTVYSLEVTNRSNVLFAVGMLPVTAISGATGRLLTNSKIYLYELMADDSIQWSASGFTDEHGLIVFDPPGLGQGRRYQLKARSPVDESSKYSDPVVEPGALTFTVGNAPLDVILVNGVSGAPVAGIEIKARERLPDGSLQGVNTHTTDDTGHTVFDLDGLGDGRIYVLSCTPYNSRKVTSTDLTATGEYLFRVGTVPVTLVNHESGQSLPGAVLTAYEKTPDGKLHWNRFGTTDALGTVHFDLPGLDENRVYVIKAKDIFGQGNSYYSDWINREGPVQFPVSPDKDYKLDLTTPEISIIQPAADQPVPDNGFKVSGVAGDNQGLTEVVVQVKDPVQGAHSSVAELNLQNGAWSFHVPGAWTTTGQTITLTARVTDDSYNSAELSISRSVIHDNYKPQIQIFSPDPGDRVTWNGFLVSGMVTDNTGIESLIGWVKGGQPMPIEVSPATGRWTLPVSYTQSGREPEGLLQIRLWIIAEDVAGNREYQSLPLKLVPPSMGDRHLLNRFSFGANTNLLEEIGFKGLGAFLWEQLYAPEQIDDSILESHLAGWSLESTRDLQNYQLMHAIYSRRQLKEVMTWFWENHFSTNKAKHGNRQYEFDEHQRFRDNALGRFRDLLQISATSPAMLLYLDNASSRKEDPNENYARELMELHTLGVNGGYEPEDVMDVARAFAGWRVKSGAFYFDPSRHADGDKWVLGHYIPPGGMEEGEAILDILATHPSTARFLCTKLAQLFITDVPDEATVRSCAGTFLATDGDLREVVRSLLVSPAFWSPENFHSKVKTPLEMLTSLVRGMEAVPSEYDLNAFMDEMGMPLFRNPAPTGWAETGDKWVSSNQMIARIDIANKIIFNRNDDRHTHLLLTDFFKNKGYETAQAVIGYLFYIALDSDYSELEWETAYNALTGEGTHVFDINAEGAEGRLRALVATVLSYPSFYLQ